MVAKFRFGHTCYIDEKTERKRNVQKKSRQQA